MASQAHQALDDQHEETAYSPAVLAAVVALSIVFVVSLLVLSWRSLVPKLLSLLAARLLGRRIRVQGANAWRLSVRGVSLELDKWTLEAEKVRLDGVEKGRLRLRARVVVVKNNRGLPSEPDTTKAVQDDGSDPHFVSKLTDIVAKLSARITLLTVEGLVVELGEGQNISVGSLVFSAPERDGHVRLELDGLESNREGLMTATVDSGLAVTIGEDFIQLAATSGDDGVISAAARLIDGPDGLFRLRSAFISREDLAMNHLEAYFEDYALPSFSVRVAAASVRKHVTSGWQAQNAAAAVKDENLAAEISVHLRSMEAKDKQITVKDFYVEHLVADADRQGVTRLVSVGSLETAVSGEVVSSEILGVDVMLEDAALIVHAVSLLETCKMAGERLPPWPRRRSGQNGLGLAKPRKLQAHFQCVNAVVKAGVTDEVRLELSAENCVADVTDEMRVNVVLSDLSLTTDGEEDLVLARRLEALKVNYAKDKGFRLVARDALDLHWHPWLHLAVNESLTSLRASLAAIGSGSSKSKRSSETGVSVILPEAELSLHCGHRIVIVRLSGGLVVARAATASAEWYVNAPAVNVMLEGDGDESIMTLTDLLISYRADGAGSGREPLVANAGLTRQANACVGVRMGSCKAWLPFQEDLHSILMVDCVGYYKWLKAMHLTKANKRSKKFLPPDISLQVAELALAMADDHFEIKLGENYNLMRDEYDEAIKRKAVLDRKVNELRSSHTSFISGAKLDKLYDALESKNREIYVKRAKLVRSKADRIFGGRPLATFQIRDLSLLALADDTMQGRETVDKFVRDVSPGDDLRELNTCIFRWIRLHSSRMEARLRDFPSPMMASSGLAINGRVLAAEQLSEAQERYTQPLALRPGLRRRSRSGGGRRRPTAPEPFISVQRSLQPIKLFCDVVMESESLSTTTGPPLDPVLAQATIAWSYLLGRKKRDGSTPLPWWDKVRYFVHGHIMGVLRNVKATVLTTMDPYCRKERVEASCKEFIFHSANCQVFELSECKDVSVKIRTTSRYENCELLHFPSLTLLATLSWLASDGGPTAGHTTVRLCDGRRPPEDSFASFRSAGVEVSAGITCPSGGRVEMFSSTQHWVERLRGLLTTGATSPPIRKGVIFGNEMAQKKMPILRHVKKISIDIVLQSMEAK